MTKRMEIVAGKNYITRGGSKVKIYDANGGGASSFPHHGAIEVASEFWAPFAWDDYGNCTGNDRAKDIVGEWTGPKLRPWMGEEIPVGAVIRNKKTGSRFVITYWCSSDPFRVGTHDGLKPEQTLMDEFEHSIDGGKTWHPCGVLEGAQ